MTNPYRSKLEQLAALVEASATFIAAVTPTLVDEEDITDRIHTPTLLIDPEQQELRLPCCVIGPGPRFEIRQFGVAASGAYHPSGDLMLTLIAAADAGDPPLNLAASELSFADFWCGVLVDIAHASRDGAEIGILAITMESPPAHSPVSAETHTGNYWHCRHSVRW
jgi:hypothetical protein